MSKKTRYLSKDQLRAVGAISAPRSLGSIAWTWGVIVACFALYCARPGVLTFAVGWIIISGRHLALGVLMHEGAHRLILRNKRWNDVVGDWLTAHPVMLNMHVYRMIHVQHHQKTWTDEDPDLYLAKDFPVTKQSMARKVLRDLTGRTGYQRYRLIARLSAGLDPRGKGLGGVPLLRALASFVKAQKGFLITNGLMLAALTLAGHPEAYVLLWLLPAFTGYSLVLRIRSIAEHAVVSDPTDELKQTRTTLAPFWLRFLIAPHHVNYHLEHHLYMFVPHYHLPAVHRLLKEAGHLDDAEIAKSYWEVLAKAMSKQSDDGAKRRGSFLPFGA